MKEHEARKPQLGKGKLSLPSIVVIAAIDDKLILLAGCFWRVPKGGMEVMAARALALNGH